MPGRSVLFIVRSFSGVGAQPIRFRHLIRHLAGDLDIHVLELTQGAPGVREDNGVTIHALPYSRLGRLVNRKSSNSYSSSSRSGSHVRFLAQFKRYIRGLFFPDTVITEALSLNRESVRLVQTYGIRVAVLSAFPFTVMLCARVLKKKTDASVILDVGDPFYRNSRNGLLKDCLARQFEKKYLSFVDRLVVTNEMTRNHYLKSFPGLATEDVHVIAMGISESLLSAFREEPKLQAGCTGEGKFTLVYAGQFYRKLREPYELYRAVELINTQMKKTMVQLDVYGSLSREFSAGYESVPGIAFRGHVQHRDIASVYRAGCGAAFIDNNSGMQTPGKVFELAVINRPVLFITDRNESPALEVVKGMKHVIVAPNKAESIAAAINAIMHTRHEYPSMNRISGFLWEDRAAMYMQIILSLSCE